MKCVYCGGTIPVAARWDKCPAHPVGGGHDTMTMEQRAAVVARVNRFQVPRRPVGDLEYPRQARS